jgi:hypothetical protein
VALVQLVLAIADPVLPVEHHVRVAHLDRVEHLVQTLAVEHLPEAAVSQLAQAAALAAVVVAESAEVLPVRSVRAAVRAVRLASRSVRSAKSTNREPRQALVEQ